MSELLTKPVYISIDEDRELRLLRGEPKEENFRAVEEGSLVILRFIPFSPEAQKATNRGGKIECLEASYYEPSDEELEEDPDAAGTWDTSWMELR